MRTKSQEIPRKYKSNTQKNIEVIHKNKLLSRTSAPYIPLLKVMIPMGFSSLCRTSFFETVLNLTAESTAVMQTSPGTVLFVLTCSVLVN